MRDRPNGSELLDIARETLLKELLRTPKDDQQLMVLMIANAMAIAGRDAGSTLGDDEVSRDLIEAMREGRHDSDRALYDRLLADAKGRLALSNPKSLAVDG